MNPQERDVLNQSLEKLEDVLPYSREELMRIYERDETSWSLEQSSGLVFCLFGYPVCRKMEQLILLVYDAQGRIIADVGAFHTDAESFLEEQEIYDTLSRESDWMYLEHYVLSGVMFPDLPYPFCKENRKTEETGQVLLYTNAYVSRAFRQRGILKTMIESMKEHALRKCRGIEILYSVFSLDPDIACYGPDARDEPYYYSYEKDEPVRRQNERIARHLGFTPLRLEPDDPDQETDGTKLWFCVRREICEILEEEG